MVVEGFADTEGEIEEASEGTDEGVEVGAIGAAVGTNSATLNPEMLAPLLQ